MAPQPPHQKAHRAPQAPHQAPLPPDFWQLDFEVETQDFTRDFPISVCFYMENFRSVGPGDKTWKHFPATSTPLLKTGPLFPAPLLDAYRASEEDVWPEEEATRLLIEWFHRCWTAAGGAAFPHRAAIAEHDTDPRLNLRTGKWVKGM